MSLAFSSLCRGALVLMASTLLGLTTAHAASDDRGPALFKSWLSTHGAEARAFNAYLHQQQVGNVAPLYQLLRSASMWRECKAQPFQVPPKAQWKSVAEVLALLREMQRKGALGKFEVVSAYRDPALNRCAGGAKRSSHTHGFAVDILPLGGTKGLCNFWKTAGRAWKMGVSRYPSGRIHLDRSSWRTWGSDYTRKTSFCS